jgi:hypothetical protein
MGSQAYPANQPYVRLVGILPWDWILGTGPALSCTCRKKPDFFFLSFLHNDLCPCDWCVLSVGSERPSHRSNHFCDRVCTHQHLEKFFTRPLCRLHFTIGTPLTWHLENFCVSSAWRHLASFSPIGTPLTSTRVALRGKKRLTKSTLCVHSLSLHSVWLET